MGSDTEQKLSISLGGSDPASASLTLVSRLEEFQGQPLLFPGPHTRHVATR